MQFGAFSKTRKNIVAVDLSKVNLLKICPQKRNQKNSEAIINGIVWKRYTKGNIVGRPTLEICLVSAVI